MNWKKGIAGMLQGFGGSVLGQRKEKSDLAKELMIAKMKGGGDRSSLGKLMQDMFGAPAEGQQWTPEQWQQAASVEKSSSYGPQGTPPFDPNQFAAMIAGMQKAFKQPAQLTPNASAEKYRFNPLTGQLEPY